MAKIYYRLVKSGKLDLADVPEKWRAAVWALLEEDGHE